MNYVEIFDKLIGPINPVGEHNEDLKRIESLKNACELAEHLINQIGHVHKLNKNSHEYSVKSAAEYAGTFLAEIVEQNNSLTK
jgi:hypothetical protein